MLVRAWLLLISTARPFVSTRPLEMCCSAVVASTLSYPLQAYKREERLAATMLRQKESRHQSYMKSREELIASSITTAFTGGERERQPIYHHKVNWVYPSH